jgi:EAL domain-containing protein (putative c-di-GMP-specific phosphodiesterase class I)/GGDEF domain-containing protein
MPANEHQAVAYTRNGNHLQANRAYLELFGYAMPDDLNGLTLLALIAPGHQPDAGQFLHSAERLGDGESTHLYAECIRADASRFTARLTASRSQLEGEPCLRVVAQEEASPAVERGPGLVDADTGLPNRQALIAELTRRLETRAEGRDPFTVFFLGIRNLPGILQRQGFSAGLKTAAAVAATLRALAPAGSYLARVSDGGYVLLVSNLGQDQALAVASRIRNAAHRTLADSTGRLPAPGCATGLLHTDLVSGTATAVLDKVYREYLVDLVAPEQPMIPMQEMGESGSDAAATGNDDRFADMIERALEGEGFRLVYQPIISLKGDSQENYSVLLRLRDQDGTFRAAGEFLPTAIRSGKMVAVDRWVIRQAVSELTAQRAAGNKTHFFVNVAEETLQEKKLLIWICDCLQEFQARGNWLTFQTLEEHVRRHPEIFAKLSEGLRKVRCRLAINHFGEGSNPEEFLKRLPVDCVTFPPHLGRRLRDDTRRRQRLQALTTLARNANVRSIATGVEDSGSLTELWCTGVDYVQGDFLQRPGASLEPRA